jgi:type VI secretion system secreted protein VgrG
VALVRDASTAQLAFQLQGGKPDEYLVTRYRGTEGLCRLFRMEIELSSALETPTLDDVVGKPAVLSVASPDGQRWFHGIVSRFELTDETSEWSYYRAELVPQAWLLTHRYRSRIFQEKKTPDILTTVFKDAGFPDDYLELRLDRTYTERPYCVQYRETDYNFVARLMEEEGIWWFFEQTQESHKLVVCDSASRYEPIEGDSPAVPYRKPGGLADPEERVLRFRFGKSVRPGAVHLTDYNFENPSLNLVAEGDSGRDPALRLHDYPGKYSTQSAGSALATIRAEEFETRRVIGTGHSNCHRLSPGKTFELSDHPSASLNQPYLVTAITHQGKQPSPGTRANTNGASGALLVERRIQDAIAAARGSGDKGLEYLAEALSATLARMRNGDLTARRELPDWLYHGGQVVADSSSAAGVLGANPLDPLAPPNLLDDLPDGKFMNDEAPVYECCFECIPAAVSFRPARTTRWPTMRGSQTARVVGPSGEEIYTDKYGRVQVQFNWNLEGEFKEGASCFIRVAQGLAGGKFGMLFLPRIGQEVIVDFLEGDPDKPIITGSVYNADHMPPYTLPEEKTRSTIKTNSSIGGGGFNEIRFEDKKDSEQLFLHAQKDLETRVLNDAKTWIGNDLHVIVTNDSFEKIDNNKHTFVKTDRNQKIEGNSNLTVDGDRAAKIGGADNLTVSGDRAAKIDGEENLEVGKNLNTKAGQTVSVDAGQEIHEKAGQNFAAEAGMDVHIKGGMNVVIEAGMNLTIKAGSNFIALGPSGVAISGTPMVMINSGGAAGSGAGCSPTAPAPPAEPDPPVDPQEADKAEAGESKEYSGPSVQAKALEVAAVAGLPFCKKCAEAAAAAQEAPVEDEEDDEYVAPPEKTWIEIQLVDEEDQPIPGELYRLTMPDGEEKEGRLDSQGSARVDEIEDPGSCTLTFPELDQEAWEKLEEGQ